MANQKRILSILLYTLCEWLFCYLILLPFSPNQWMIVLPFMAFAVIHSLLIVFLKRRKHADAFSLLMVSLLIGLLALVVVHMSLLASATLTALITYFAVKREQKQSSDRLSLLILLFAIVVIIYVLFAVIRQPVSLFFLLLIEIMASISWISLNLHKQEGRWLLISSGTFLAASAVLTTIVIFAKPWVEMVYNTIFNLIVRPITYGVATLLFGWLSSLSNLESARRIHKALQSSSAARQKNGPQSSFSSPFSFLSFDQLMGILIVVAILIFAFLLYRKAKRKNLVQKQNEVNGGVIIQDRFDHSSGQGSKRFLHRRSIPKNQVRRAIFQLQKKASKHKLGRYGSESLSEWLERLCIPQTGTLTSAYEKVRYGENTLTDSEKVAFFQAIKEAKKQILELSAKTKNK
ncbi:hypothetical protein ACFP7A_02310 [Sporolactobacillus kofuensis]|uniref:DUF4129 domain-containing protein n=1 Tax=Sporolactobacillus kofuensis TaxID=269672 RepID=A0ABW1WCV0_9BACL|nr:hypothetical protein [Sporolactobacillus kofuensis]MCO7174766.1 hypothetical protein [Sporolactobacillus kofuensis]